MSNRWKFTDNTKTLDDGTILHQIQATESFSLSNGLTVKSGELGGWIEKEDNLHDCAWVSDNALVCGNARVYGDAQMLTIGPIGSRNDTTTFFVCNDGKIRACCGCFTGTLDEFRKKVKETHGETKHAQTYLKAAELAELQIEIPEDWRADND